MAASLLRRSKVFSLLDIVRRTGDIVTLTSNRSIMTGRGRLEKVMENLQTNPYFEKYATKIAKLQETSPEEFMERIEEKERKVKAEREQRARERKQFEADRAAKPLVEPGMQTKEARLDSIMKLEMIEGKSKEEIIEIWHQYHKQKDCIAAVLTPEQFKKLFERGKKYSTFILPLPRENGYEFIMIQFQRTEIHMTPLLWYQTHKENAPECLTMVHYTELIDSKDIVLMRGDFDSKALSATEAQCLANELQMYYSSDHPQRLKLLETFTEKPDEFKHMDLIAHLETISFDAGASGSLPKGQNK